jgi:signal transduction histidine kinase
MRWWASALGPLSAGRRRQAELEQRHQRALEIHDGIVQGLVTAKLALELGETERGLQVLEETLDAARQLVGDLVTGPDGTIDLRAGDLRRSAAAGPR